MPVRNVDFAAIVKRVDPDWHRDNEENVEYEFSKDREFKGFYKSRGPYAPE